MSARGQIPIKPPVAPVRPFSPVPFGVLQRKCACGGSGGSGGTCEECKKKRTLQRRAVGDAQAGSVPPIVHEVLRSPGQPLDAATRGFMEPRFGHDFSRVRLHTDSKAARSADAVQAHAYTVGRNVVFGAGRYEPATRAGRELLAHELTHVVQQKGTSGSANLRVGSVDDPGEREADAMASGAMGVGEPVTVQTPALIQRQAAPATDPAPNAPAQGQQTPAGTGTSPGCTPGAGIGSSSCSAYAENSSWLPLVYVNNATCACTTTPDVPTAKCVRKFLQDRLAATPTWFKVIAASQKVNELANPVAYMAFVQAVLTPRIHSDHVDAYRSCCCPAGPAPYLDWVGVTTIPFRPCGAVGWFIRHFGSCTGTSGEW
jgi:hypothetical protein